jgi:hypothetical protein
MSVKRRKTKYKTRKAMAVPGWCWLDRKKSTGGEVSQDKRWK